MGVWTRCREERVVDFQPPPYSEHWQYADDVTIVDPQDHRELDLVDYGPSLIDEKSKVSGSEKASFYPEFELRQRRPNDKVKEEATTASKSSKHPLSSHHRLRSKDMSNVDKKSWLHNLKKKHQHKRSKSSSSSSIATSNRAPKFTAVPISVEPPKIRNKIILSEDTISLFDPAGRDCFEPHPFKVTLETTLLEDRPYTIRSTVLQRDITQNLETALSHFEVVDVETGYVLSKKPAPITTPATTTTHRNRRHKAHKSKSGKGPLPGITRNTCAELAPHRSSHLTMISRPSPSKSSTERLFDALRIQDPTLLVGRQLKLRLIPDAVAMWSSQTMEEVFGYQDEVKGWPNLYGKPLVLRCADGEGVEDEDEDEDEAEFSVVMGTEGE
jgi:hypothetical protein